ncbi:MAG: hypothetical protein R3360_06705, partial [Alphaproteobacteria bacterium]|nr:hypothetical protein [Alphaproteobacteria bacterium]
MRKFVCLWMAALATTLMSAPQPVSAQMSDVRPPVSDMPTPTSRPAPVMRPGQSGATLFSVQQQRRQQIREDKGCDEKLKLVNDLEQRLRKIRERCEKLEVRQRKREEDLRKTEQEVEEERQRRADLRAEQQRKGDAYRAALAEREQAKARLDAAKDALKRAQQAAIDYFVERTDTEREDWHLSPPEGEEDSFVALEVKPGLTLYLDNSDGLWTPTRIRNGEFWLRDEFRESDQGRDIRDAIEDAKKELEEAQKAFDEAEAAEGEAGDAFYEADQAVHGLPPLTQPLTRAEERLQEAVDTLRDCREEEVATANRLAEARSELEECEKEAAAEAELERVQREAEEQIEELEDQIKEAEEDLKEAEEELSQPLPEDASEEAKEEREEAQRDAEEARRAIEEAKAAIDAAKNAIGLGPMDPGLDSPAAVRKAAREAEKKLVQATGKSQTGSTKASGAKQRIKDVRASEAERRRLRAQRLARANRGIGRVKNALIDLSDQTKARAGGGLFGIG